MSEFTVIQKVAHPVLKVCRALAFLPPLLTRLVLGGAFAEGGWGKLHHIDGVTEMFISRHIPMPHANAIFIASLEFFGGILLVLGLFTRPVAALLGATMLVASMGGDDNDSIVKALSDYDLPSFLGVTPIVFGMFLLWLLIYGPGWASIDAVLRKALHLDPPSSKDAA